MVQLFTSIKHNIFIVFVSLRNKIIPIIFLSFTLGLVIFSNSNLVAAKDGLKLWANNVVPALFPFFIATELLSYTTIPIKISKLFTKVMRPIFNVPGNAAYAFIMGIISGYPVGAKIVTDFRLSNSCTKDEGERMLAFTNNSGPLFIIGTVGITLFRSTTIGFLLFITHFLSSITVGIILGIISRFKKNSSTISYSDYTYKNKKTLYSLSNLGEIITSSIKESIKTILIIGGFVVLFSVILSILNTSNILSIITHLFYPFCNYFNLNPSFISGILSGFIELTNGVALVTNIPCKLLTINICICAFLLGFGGISILLQILSISSKSDLSIKPYIYGKLLQGIIAAFYTYILINSFGFLNFDFI